MASLQAYQHEYSVITNLSTTYTQLHYGLINNVSTASLTADQQHKHSFITSLSTLLIKRQYRFINMNTASLQVYQGYEYTVITSNINNIYTASLQAY